MKVSPKFEKEKDI